MRHHVAIVFEDAKIAELPDFSTIFAAHRKGVKIGSKAGSRVFSP